MRLHMRVLCTLALTVAVAIWLGGCGGGDDSETTSPSQPAGETHADGDHEEANHGEGEHGEHGEHKEGEHAEEHGHAEGHGHSAEEMKEHAEMLADYSEAMHEIGELREQIEHLIESGKLTQVHPPAEMISVIAKRLPGLASKSGVPKEHWKDINILSRDLANLFDEIDEAADANKKPETETAFAKMIKLIDGLNTHPKHD